MAAAISTSMTTGAVRGYAYPEHVNYVLDSGSTEILYSMLLAPRQDPRGK